MTADESAGAGYNDCSICHKCSYLDPTIAGGSLWNRAFPDLLPTPPDGRDQACIAGNVHEPVERTGAAEWQAAGRDRSPNPIAGHVHRWVPVSPVRHREHRGTGLSSDIHGARRTA